jgi:hypothetical protein
MPSKSTLIKKLAGTKPKPKMIVEDQEVKDIVRQMMIKTEATKGDYDKIYKDFLGGDIDDICQRLFDFCIDNIELNTESIDSQYVSSPITILQRGYSDCKCYALFCGGVLDAMKRHGYKLDWCYRFASYNWFNSEKNHVFTVVNPKTDDIWIDPVLGEYNYHYGYAYKEDKRPKKAASITGLWDHPVEYIQAAAAAAAAPVTNGTYDNAAVGLPGTDPAGQAAAGELNFLGARTGVLLPSIPGYPPDLPQLQISPSGRLSFYNWPMQLSSSLWADLSSAGCAPLAKPLSNLDWTGTYLRIATRDKITQDQYNQMKAAYTAGAYVYDFASYITSGTCGTGWYSVGRPYMWIFQNVQYYIDKYLKNPYSVTELIPYGTNWADQFKAAMMGGTAKFTTYLQGVNFLIQPVGSQGFWDKFYLSAPLIITAIAAVVTDGAATPALLAAVSSLAVKYGEAKAAAYSQTALPQQGAAQANTTAIQLDTGTASTLTTLTAWVKGHPMYAALILASIGFIIYEND